MRAPPAEESAWEATETISRKLCGGDVTDRWCGTITLRSTELADFVRIFTSLNACEAQVVRKDQTARQGLDVVFYERDGHDGGRIEPRVFSEHVFAAVIV